MRASNPLARIRGSWLIAGGIVVALALWFASGVLGTQPETAAKGKPADAAAKPFTVAVRPQAARSVERLVVVQGQSEPRRTVTVRAETDGQIREIVAKRGRLVKKGQVIARMAMDDRGARLKEAEAEVKRQESIHSAWAKLSKKGHQAANKVAEAMAALEAARARLERIRIEITNTEIRAPIDGILEFRKVEVGDYVKNNTEVATLVDIDPIVVSGQIPQQAVARLKVGGMVGVRFVTGEVREGRIRFIAATADAATRTFKVEADVANRDLKLPAGLSAELRIVTGTVMAHLISPALLSLGADGSLSVKAVDESGVVKTHAIEVVRAETGGLWVSGLPAQARIITRGQGFVRAGDKVRAVTLQSDGAPAIGQAR